MTPIFHMAFHVQDIDAARDFYENVLGCTVGRTGETWVDLNFFGHQLSLHNGAAQPATFSGVVESHAVPMPHFGVILPMETWSDLAGRLTSHGVDFEVSPMIRFAGQPGEQGTLFFYDPSGNAIELKGFVDMTQVFET